MIFLIKDKESRTETMQMKIGNVFGLGKGGDLK